jgi:lipoic acid synthetase
MSGKKRISLADSAGMKHSLRKAGLHTVCESALCPNRGECFSRGIATFLIAGNTCTRQCRFCGVGRGKPSPLDLGEPRRIADFVHEHQLKYVVVTSVTRDDLPDGGARHFRNTVETLRLAAPGTNIEILVPDFAGNRSSAEIAFAALPAVFAHNIETVPRLYAAARQGADYRRSLELLRWAKEAKLTTKSGIMVGLGERESEVLRSMDDLRSVNCDILTIGQYLAPTKAHIPVTEHLPSEQFDAYRAAALSKGFRHCASGTYVRSSYLAENMLA